MRRLVAVVVAAMALLLGGCTVAVVTPSAPATPSATAADGPVPDATGLLARHGLDGLTPQQLVESLDASEEDREQGPFGSVRPHELVLSDDEGEVVIPLGQEGFYLAIAPYRDTTHDCFNHNLASCQGELAGEPLSVSVMDDAGATLVDEEVTTHANGFAGIWLPRDIAATLTVSHNGDTATAKITTGSGDPTCVTTLRLG